MTTELETAVEAAKLAGAFLRENFNKPHKVDYKGVINIVTMIDRQAEKLIAEILADAYPSYGILAEEGTKADGSNCWVVDPLDGTNNFVRGHPLFAVSIALVKKGQTVLGVVYNPVRDELFSAEAGKGAFLNRNSIHVSDIRELGGAVLASGFPYDAWTNPVDNCSEFRRFVKQVFSMRCDGSAALDLCHVAAGRLDGYWEQVLEPWDMAAGALIIQEAGGKVTSVDGEDFTPFGRGVLASNGRVHADMLAVLLQDRK
jgi:myo-inositol-1(or 4)-monophosphatase